jgi:hypothetical protein
MRHPRPVRRSAFFVLVAVLAATAAAQGWSWFVEPFSVRVTTVHPQAGAIEGLLVIGEHAVRNEWTVAGQVSATVLRLDPPDAAVMWTFLPEGLYLEQRLAYADAPELFDEGYVAAVTAPDDPRHVCVRNPDVHRCAFVANETVGGRGLERWRIEAAGRDGVLRGQSFWFDRSAGVVVRALDDTGADLAFSDHRRGPVDPAAFEVPAGYRRP